MKKNITALALALALVGALAACSADRDGGNTTGSGVNGTNSTNAAGTSGSNPAGSGVNGAGFDGAGVSAGQVARNYGRDTIYNGRTYWDDGRYAAGTNGKVYNPDGNSVSRDLTQGARDIVRGAENAAGDVGRGIKNAARDITGVNSSDSSAARH